jgi:NAD(P)-dependent dehydrogenase (short-subunit alcohol dehydrogenase family)
MMISRERIFLSVLLTNLLLDDLKRSAPSRIVVVSSKLHDPKTKFGKPVNFQWTLDEINNESEYDGMMAYKNSQLANIWFAYELARRLKNTGVDVHVLCPVKSSIFSSFSSTSTSSSS